MRVKIIGSFVFYEIELFAEHEIAIGEIDFSSPLKQLVFMDDKVIENNLRMIDSIFPEILFAFSKVTKNQTKSVSEAIEQLIKMIFSNLNSIHSKHFLACKIIDFFEAVMFADLYSGVWRGRFNTRSYYINNQNEQIEIYRYAQVRQLLMNMLDEIYIAPTNIKSNGKNYIQIRFKIQKEKLNGDIFTQ